MSKEEINQLLAVHELTVHVVFVPFSQSRYKHEKEPSLNWLVTLERAGKDILTTDYMQGCGHCPGYKNPPTYDSGESDQYGKRAVIAFECETGYTGVFVRGLDNVTPRLKSQILPDAADVLYSLVQDASVIDYGSFESWASEFGYDTDSRKAEKTYRDCLEIALKLRNGLGDDVMKRLQEAFQDY